MKKRMIILFCVASLWGAHAHAQAANVYVTQDGSSQAGCTLTPRYSAAQFNTAGNWGAGGTQIGPDTVVHLCGTFTGGLNTTMLTAQSSGTSGHPITILAESGTNLTSPAWAQTGAINLAGRSFITADGGTNGIIQNTANGTDLANHQPSIGIVASICNNCIVKNWTIANIYHTVAFQPIGGSLDRSFLNAILIGGSNVTVTNNTMYFCMWCVQEYFNGHDDANIDISYNTLHDFDHGWIIASTTGNTATNVAFHDNNVYDTAAADGIGHHDGIHAFESGSHTASIHQMYIYNNYWHGDWGSTPTGFIFIEGPMWKEGKLWFSDLRNMTVTR